MNEHDYIDILQKEMLIFMFSAKEAKDIIFSKSDNKEIKCLAKITYAQQHLTFAKSIYYSLIDDKRDQIEEIFYLADNFVKEITDNIAKNHSQQWSDIKFSKLAEKFDYSVLSNTAHFGEEY